MKRMITQIKSSKESTHKRRKIWIKEVEGDEMNSGNWR